MAPELRLGDIVILDNLSSQKGDEAAALVAERGATLLFLSPYSPDLKPIEMAFAKLKHLLRKAGKKSRDAPLDALGALLDLFPPGERQNYLRRADYATV